MPIGNAQKKVEGYHFDIRKHVLQFDDVMEKQRSIIYSRRREILGDSVQELMLEMSGDVVDELFDQHCSEKYVDQWDASGFNQAFTNIFGKLPKENWHEQELDAEEFREQFHQQVEDLYREKLTYFHSELGQNLAAEQAAADLAAAQEELTLASELIESLNEGLRSFGESAKQLNETITAASAISEYNGQIQEGVKNMNALNSLYELQLQTSNQQMEATNLFLQNLQSSVEDSKKFQQQVANLAENLEALNSVYANMLNAMNPNK